MKKIRVSIVGASGYVGGETLRLLLQHPNVEIVNVTSESNIGKFVHILHPNLRKRTQLKFTSIEDLEEVDVIFLGLPHKVSSKKIEYGIPELHKEEIKKADYVAAAGCNATATILGLYPLFKNNMIDMEKTVVEVKAGSSQAGNKSTPGSHHPERKDVVRSYKPTGHRHMAEVMQELNSPYFAFSATSIGIVRGILMTGHVVLKEDLQDKDVWKVYRQEYGQEPFIRLVKERQGIYRYPEPKLLWGTNYCDIGFEIDKQSNRLVVISAIDNLMKGAAGQAVQCMNLMFRVSRFAPNLTFSKVRNQNNWNYIF
jgi:N-acetyl-gamma-glutamyl-phosphate/LysW-gamma-L-alpha-aminoadipyl-6-phosphate reductase